MGLWSFMKDTGKSLFGSDEPSTDKVQKEIADLGLDDDGLRVRLVGDVSFVLTTIDGRDHIARCQATGGCE